MKLVKVKRTNAIGWKAKGEDEYDVIIVDSQLWPMKAEGNEGWRTLIWMKVNEKWTGRKQWNDKWKNNIENEIQLVMKE